MARCYARAPSPVRAFRAPNLARTAVAGGVTARGGATRAQSSLRATLHQAVRTSLLSETCATAGTLRSLAGFCRQRASLARQRAHARQSVHGHLAVDRVRFVRLRGSDRAPHC